LDLVDIDNFYCVGCKILRFHSQGLLYEKKIMDHAPHFVLKAKVKTLVKIIQTVNNFNFYEDIAF